jgi:hypothetical protein
MPALLACSDKETSSPATNGGNNTAAPAQVTDAPAQATQEANKAAAAPGAVAESAYVRVYLNAITDPYTSDNSFIKPGAGKRWVSFDVTVEYFNDSDTHGANPFNFGLSDAQSFAYDPTFYGPDPQLNAVDLRPNEKTRGRVTFEVGEASKLQSLRYKPNIFKDSYIEFDFPQ